MIISGIQRFFLKKSTTTFDETSVKEIICEMQQNDKIDGKFKIINPIYDDKIFAKTPSKFISKLATTIFLFQKNQSILRQLTLILMIIAQPIKLLPVKILLPIIQINLHLIAKLL